LGDADAFSFGAGECSEAPVRGRGVAALSSMFRLLSARRDKPAPMPRCDTLGLALIAIESAK